MKAIKVEIVGLVLREKEDVAEGIVKINGVEKKVVVRDNKQYSAETHKYIPNTKIIIENFSEEACKILGISLDCTDLNSLFYNKVNDRNHKREIEKINKREKFWDSCPLHEIVKKFSSFVFVDTKDVWIKDNSQDIVMIYNEKYKDRDIKIKVQYEAYYSGDVWHRSFSGYRFVVEDSKRDYSDRSRVKRLKNIESALKTVEAMINTAKSNIDYSITAQKNKLTAIEEVKQEIGNNIFMSTYYSSGISRECYSSIVKGKDKEKGIKFIQYYEKGEYQIKEVVGTLSAQQIKQIIEIVNQAKF